MLGELKMNISDWHQEACQMMPNSVAWNGFFYPILTQIVDSFSYSSLNTSFYIEKKHGKCLQKILNILRCNIHVTWSNHFNITMTSPIDVRTVYNRLLLFVFFIFPMGWYGLCEIENYLTWVKTQNPDRLCKKYISFKHPKDIVWLEMFVCLFDVILYIPVNNVSVMLGRVFLGWTSTKQGLMCHAQGHNTVMPARLEPATILSRDTCPQAANYCALFWVWDCTLSFITSRPALYHWATALPWLEIL